MRFKIYFLLSLTLCVPVSARAGYSDNYSGDIMSLNFYPHEGLIKIDAETTSSLSFHSATASIFANSFSLTGSYGILPGLRCSLSEALLWDEVSEGASNSSLQNGLANPTATIGWRILEDSSTGLSADLSGGITPSIGASIPANPNLNVSGNNLTGFTTVDASSTVFWRFHENEFSISGSLARRFQGRVNGTDATTSEQLSANTATTYTIGDRIHFGPRYFVEVSFAHTSIGNSTRIYDSGVQKVVTSNPYWLSTAEIGFRPEPYYGLFVSVSSVETSSTTTQANTASSSASAKEIYGQLYFVHQFKP